MEKEICHYTEDMIKSENIFLKHIEDFTKPVNMLKLKTNINITPIDKLEMLTLGMNKGEKVPRELKERLQRKIPSKLKKIDLSNIFLETEVIVVGSGAAGLSAAIEIASNNISVLILTKGKFGQSNTVLAQGGIQAATEIDDSVGLHYEDTMKSGHYKNNSKLVRKLTNEAPKALKWLTDLGVQFREEPLLSGGTSRKRLHSVGDRTGASIMKALIKESEKLKEKKLLKVKCYADVKELVKDSKGNIAGVIYKENSGENLEEYKIIKSKVVILATGGMGSLKFYGLNTSNCEGSTADGMAMAYHAGAKLINPGAIQYHPTGGAYPECFKGKLISEKARALGAILFNKDGNPLISQGNRDEIVKIIMENIEEGKGVRLPTGGYGIWLATPLIDRIYGNGTIQKKLPSLYNKYKAVGIDITKHAILIYPTIHYQLGGIEIDSDGKTSITNLFAIGEVSGGIDGDNRLMGNALLSAIVYGRTAGKEAANIAKSISMPKKLSIYHLKEFYKT